MEIARERVPLRKLLHNSEIREAAKNLENFRLMLNEHEILYGCKLVLKVSDYGECHIVAVREESDAEYNSRVERARVLAEQRAAARQRREIREQQRRIEADKLARSQTLESLKQQMAASGLTVDDLIEILEPGTAHLRL